MICGHKSKTQKAMIEHLKLVHKEAVKNNIKPTVAGGKKTYRLSYIAFGLIATFVIGTFINSLLSMPHVNSFLLYTGSIALYVLFCVLILGFSLDSGNVVLKSFMIGTLGIVPGLIVESLFHESKGKSRFYFLITLFLSWLSTIAIVFMIFAVLTFVIG